MDKAPEAFRTISEVAEELDLPQHVLRFWESRFREIKPMKRGGGRRYYRPDDVSLLRGIRYLLYGEGYTIRGVQRILREQGVRFVEEIWQRRAVPAGLSPPQIEDDDEAVDQLAEAFEDEAEEEELPAAPSPRVEPASTPPPPRTGLSRDDVRRLQDALHELHECRRLIDAALAQG